MEKERGRGQRSRISASSLGGGKAASAGNMKVRSAVAWHGIVRVVNVLFMRGRGRRAGGAA